MNVWQCIPCGISLWEITEAGTIQCSQCGKSPDSMKVVFLYVKPELRTASLKEVKP